MRKWRYSYIIIIMLRHQTEVSGQVHALAALSLETWLLVSIGLEAGWASVPASTIWSIVHHVYGDYPSCPVFV
jgi:hypothetical protein